MINIVLPNFFTADIIGFTRILWCSPLVFANVYLSSRYRRVTSAYSSNYQRKSSRIDFRRITFSNAHFESSDAHFELCDAQFVRYVLNDQSRYVWMWFAMIFADSSMNTRRSREDSSMNLDVNVCKNHRRVCFIRGEEFKRVGRTIFIEYRCFFLPIY